MNSGRPEPITEPEAARKRALRLLKAKARSRRDLVSALIKRGVVKELAERIAGDLERAGLIDDRALAEATVRNQVERKPVGPGFLQARLARQGVPRQIAADAVRQGLAGRDALADATGLVKARLARGNTREEDPRKARARLVAWLARRGFDPDVCFRAVDAAMPRPGRGPPTKRA